MVKRSSSSAHLLRTNPPFRSLWLSAGISAAGDELFDFALLILTTVVYGHTLNIALVGVAIAVPYMLVGPVAGSVVDRGHVSPAKMMRVAEGAAGCLILVVVLLPPRSSFWSQCVAYAVIFTVNGLGMLVDVVSRAALPAILGEETGLIRRANASLGSQFSLVQATVPAGAGLLLTLMHPRSLFFLDAVTFLVSCLLLRRFAAEIARTNPVRRTAAAQPMSWRFMFEGARLLFKDRLLRIPMAVLGISNMLTFALGLSLPSFLTQRHEPVWLLGPALAAMAAGRSIGSWACGRSRDGRLIVALPLEPAVRAGALIGVTLVPNAYVLIVCLFLMGFPTGYAQVARVTLLQTRFSPETRGRVFSQYMAMNRSMLPLGAIVAGAAITVVGPQTFFALQASAFAAMSGAIVWSFRPLFRGGTASVQASS